MPSKSGTSGLKNLGRLTSRIERSTNTCSDSSGKARLRLPAAVSTDLTARIP